MARDGEIIQRQHFLSSRIHNLPSKVRLRNDQTPRNVYMWMQHKVLGRILKVGVQIFKQGVQGSNVHDLFNPVGPRRSPLFPRETPSQSNFMQSMLTIHLTL